MDRELVLAKLESLRRCLERVESQRIVSLEDLQQSPDKQDIAVLNVGRSVQLCVDIASHLLAETGALVPDTMAGAFRGLAAQGILETSLAEKLGKAVGFRNIAVHQYQDIDQKILYAVVTDCLQDFRSFAKAVLVVLKDGLS